MMFYDVETANDPDVEPSMDNEEQQDIPTSTKDDRLSNEDNLSDERHVAQTVKTFAFRTVLTTPDKFCNELSCNFSYKVGRCLPYHFKFSSYVLYID